MPTQVAIYKNTDGQKYALLPFGAPVDWNDLTYAQQADIIVEQAARRAWYERVNAKS